MAKMSEAELNTIVTAYIDSTKIGGVWTPSYGVVSGLLNKVGKLVSLDSEFNDDLGELDGENLPFGKTIEEYFQDLILPVDFDEEGADTLAPHYPSYRPISYSYDLGTKTIPTTIKKNEFEKGCMTAEGTAKMVNMITKRLYDSLNVYRYQCKLNLLANAFNKADSAMSTSTTFAASTAYAVNTYLKTTGAIGVVVKAIGSSSTATWAQNVADGHIIVLDLAAVLAKPDDQTSAQAFITELKKDIELAQFNGEGHSLNGNTLCAKGKLTLYVIPGIKPILDTYLYSNAFNKDELSLPVTIKTIKSLPGTTNGYAMLVDTRGIKLHNSWRDIEDQRNAQGGFTNFFLHDDETAFISRNTFIKAYKGS